MIRYRSSTGPARLLRLAASLLCIAALVSSCVSSPAPEAAPDEKPAVIEGFRLSAPGPETVELALTAPEPPPRPEGASPASTQAASPSESGDETPPRVDVTVLSRLQEAPGSGLRGSMDEPTPPPAAAPAAAPAGPPAPAPAPQRTTPAPATPATPAPRTASQAPAAPSPPAAAAPAPTTQATPAPAPIPSPPPSTQRIASPVEPPKPDRQIEATRNQRFEIRLLGSGWTYLGDEDGKDGLRFETRRFEGNEAVFTLRPERSDDYLLRFQRNDPVSGERETILAKVSVRDVGQAPSQAQAATQPTVPATSAAGQDAGHDATQDAGAALTPSPEAEASVPVSPVAPAQASSASALASIREPEALLAFARSELDARRVRSALDALDRYVELFRRGSDELFYLYGLAYEQDTPFRDIKKAHENYKRVRDEYPRSPRWRAAAERVVYLERHFYGLR